MLTPDFLTQGESTYLENYFLVLGVYPFSKSKSFNLIERTWFLALPRRVVMVVEYDGKCNYLFVLPNTPK